MNEAEETSATREEGSDGCASSINQREMRLSRKNLRKFIPLMRKDGCQETIITS